MDWKETRLHFPQCHWPISKAPQVLMWFQLVCFLMSTSHMLLSNSFWNLFLPPSKIQLFMSDQDLPVKVHVRKCLHWVLKIIIIINNHRGVADDTYCCQIHFWTKRYKFSGLHKGTMKAFMHSNGCYKFKNWQHLTLFFSASVPFISISQ